MILYYFTFTIKWKCSKEFKDSISEEKQMKTIGLALFLFLAVQVYSQDEVGQFDKRKELNQKQIQEEKQERSRKFDEIVDEIESNRIERDEIEKKISDSKAKGDDSSLKTLMASLEENKNKGKEIEKKLIKLSE